MDSPLFDQSRDPMLAFASEASITPTADREPAFLRTPTAYDGHLSITSVAEQAPSEPVRGWRVTTILVVAGVLTGFAGGYVFADRIITPAVTPAPRVTAPVSAPAPAATAAAAPTVAPASEPAKSSAEPSTEPAREPGVVEAKHAADASVASTAPAPQSTPRAALLSSTTRPSTSTTRPSTSTARSSTSTTRSSTTTPPRPTVAPTAPLSGAIEIMSRPRDAQVFLDGILVGRAPMSIPDVAEGTHEVRVELDGFRPWVGSVRVKGGSRARVGASLEP
jgi:hypothetical protein